MTKKYALGDKFTIAGRYKRRSFLQWLRREPKQLQEYIVKESCAAYCRYEEVDNHHKEKQS